MNKTSIGPALDLGKVIEMKKRLEDGNLITTDERKALHRIIMSYGSIALAALANE